MTPHPEGPLAGRDPQSGTAARAVAGWRRIPWLATSLALLAWLAVLVAGGPGPAPAGWATGVGPVGEGRWWTVLTAAGWWGGIGGYVVTTVLLIGLGGLVVERTVGAGRAAVLLVSGQVAATLLALGAVAAGAALGRTWAETLADQQAVGAAPGIVAAAAAVTTGLSALWRRRLRLVLGAAALMLVAYSGELSDVLLLWGTAAGLVAGRFVVGHGERRVGRPSGPEARVLVALLVAVSAVGPVVAAVAQAPIGPLSVLKFVVLSPPPNAQIVKQICAGAVPEIDPEDCAQLQARLRLSGLGPALGSAAPVLLLLVVAVGLLRGRRAAWAVGIGLNLALAGLGTLLAVLIATTPEQKLVVYGGAPGTRQVLAVVLPPLLPLGVAVLLWLTRRRFAVRAPAGAYRRVLRLAVVTFLGASALYVLGSRLVADQFDRPPGTVDLLADLPLRFLPPGYLGEIEPAFLPQGTVATLLFEWVGPVFWSVVAAGLLAAFVRPRVEPSDGAAAAARELLVQRGGSNLAWMTTWPGNAHWLTDTGDAAVAYRVIGPVALTVGDPVGAPSDRVAAVDGFAAFCREHGWTPAFYSVTEPVRARCAQLGWSAVQVAEETVLDLPGLAFTGKKWQDVRTAVNRAAKSGITAEWVRYAEAPRVITDQIRAISEEWVADKGLPEMGFTLGGVDELADPAVRCLVAVDADRTVHGVTSWLPIHREGKVVGATLDFMRRRSSGGFRPVMEFLIASAAGDLRDEGLEVLSLSGAPLARLDRGTAPSSLQRVLDAVGGALEPVYGFRSLLAYKAKFQPRHEPLFLTYPDPVALPAIGIAIGRAYLPGLDPRGSARLLSGLRAARRPPAA